MVPDYSDVAMEISMIAQEHKIPILTTYPTKPKVTEGGDFTFMGAYTDPYQVKVIANFAI